MFQVKIVKIVFDTDIQDFEIPAFRGAVIDTVGRDHVIFHNHIGEDKFHYKYPAVQYKREGRSACIVCVKDGVDEIHNFFSKNSGSILIGNKRRPLEVKSIVLNTFKLHVSDKQYFEYSLQSWLPLHGDNFQKFLALESLIEQVGFLERILVGNILSMAKGLDWRIDKPIEVKITSIRRQYKVKHKKQSVISFDLDFKTNVFLPNYIGLGKSSSIGFGTIQKTRISNTTI